MITEMQMPYRQFNVFLSLFLFSLLFSATTFALDPASVPMTEAPKPAIQGTHPSAGEMQSAMKSARQGYSPRPLGVTPPDACKGNCCDSDKDDHTVQGTTYWKSYKKVEKTGEGLQIVENEKWHSGTDYCKYENGPYLIEFSCQNYDKDKATRGWSGYSRKQMVERVTYDEEKNAEGVILCPDGDVCSGGKCVPKHECTDSDVGKSYFQPGSVKAKSGDGPWSPPETDSCLDGKILKEQLCVATEGGNKWDTFYFDCAAYGWTCNPSKTISGDKWISTYQGAGCDLPDKCQVTDGKNPLDDEDSDGVPDIHDYAWQDPTVQYSPYPLSTATVGQLGDKCVVFINQYYDDSITPNCQPETYAISYTDLLINGKDAEKIVVKTCNKGSDTDEDGIKDCIETGLGMDPNSIDSDNDSLPEGNKLFEEPNGEIAAVNVKTMEGSSVTIYCNKGFVEVTRKDGKELCIPSPEGGGETTGMDRYWTDPLNHDTDGDDELDGNEIYGNAIHGKSDPIRWDTDCDGLSDGLEDAVVFSDKFRTEPKISDTDGDGLRDGLIVSGGVSQKYSYSEEIHIWGEDLNNNGIKEPWETDPTKADTDGDDVDDLDDLCPTNANPNCCPLYFVPAMDVELKKELKDSANTGCFEPED